MRELVVLRPIDARTAITAPDLEVTMEGLRTHEGAAAISWRGWRKHRGSLGKPLEGHELAALEETCVLPDDYRRFLTDVAGSGAGPGYGLLSPLGAAQAALARGSFSWNHEQQAPPDTGGVIALAHAGCSVMWLLVVEGVHRGEVWLDARGSDRGVRRVAPTFHDWDAAWLDAAVRDAAPWTQWDASCCSTPHAFSSYLDENPPTDDGPPLTGKLNPAALRISGLGETYFERGAPLDPCHACVLLAEHLGADDEVFAPGDDPRPGSDAGKRSGGLFGRLSKHLRKGRQNGKPVGA